MTTTSAAGRTLFVTLPVSDVERSMAFFGSLGFEFDPAFSSDDGVCMVVNDRASVMLAQREMFASLSKLPVGDPLTHALTLFCFDVPTREDVDQVSAAALAAGGREADGPEDHGFMYTRAFFDLDGHGWQVMWMNPDPTAAPEGAGEPADAVS